MEPLQLLLATVQGEAALFYLTAVLVCAGAVGVVVCRDMIRAGVCLLASLLGVAGLFFLLKAEFLGVVQLIVFAGGTAVILMFGVMLTARKSGGGQRYSAVEVLPIAALAILLLGAMLAAIWNSEVSAGGYRLSGYPLDKIGQSLLTDVLVPFELSSVLLLVAMIGAAFLTRRSPRTRVRS
jgi:NADH:ubiquinone oxidoreductase subunit 6 (subunit J)